MTDRDDFVLCEVCNEYVDHYDEHMDRHGLALCDVQADRFHEDPGAAVICSACGIDPAERGTICGECWRARRGR